mmetsp:Transcript_10432/g.28501  ORF Transcript_10432/g.28501 Transcript_10432/m.28501 type:complete len:203 (-) Transcript_10432:127-735(-)|eukprot:CAMPEP_0202346370 /NCGR_PEP_ID=MMETSP1126-20121109/5188_1 /ASSEMBLY_ACC=CAM_ASM_000457 /TAXON_ID=3047 /ORGANISM="Dunaliella tertiolecta, Strain CCMP1320" /LENGTH=202 /DNA_ID=CAMNT_0048937765 /DNA_START=79 /DNA_END=687 /DNA_ORIENTATION=+
MHSCQALRPSTSIPQHVPLRRRLHAFSSRRPILAKGVPSAAEEQGHSKQQQDAPVLALGVISLAASSLVAPFVALAEDVQETQAEAGALVSQANQASQSASDTFVSIAFTIVIGLLTIVTLGVAYLSLMSWLDSREENKAKLEASQSIRGLPSEKQRPKAQDPEDKQEEEMLASLRRGESKRDKSRGFASAAKGRESSPREF